MIDLTKCAVERLRADDTFILYRAHRAGGARSLLALVPRQPTIRSLEKLENEYALAADLDPAWAVTLTLAVSPPAGAESDVGDTA